MLVTLEQESHTYTDDRGSKYKSATSFISEFKDKFDPYKLDRNGQTLIANYVKKNGYSEQYWLDVWADKRDYSCEKGHAFHTLKEMFITNSAYYKAREQFLPVRNVQLEWMKIGQGNFRDLPFGIYPELIMWDYSSKLAGMGDLPMFFENREVDIVDYKTNEIFQTDSFNSRPMKFPFTHLNDCHLGHYTVQLSLYAWFLEQNGWKPRNLSIEHYSIPDKEVQSIINHGVLPNIKPTIYEVPYERDAIKLMVSERRKQIRNRYVTNRSRR